MGHIQLQQLICQKKVIQKFQKMFRKFIMLYGNMHVLQKTFSSPKGFFL